MELQLKRIAKKPDYTIGRISVNGQRTCDVLEDTDRGLRQDMPLEEIKRLKQYGKTAIPTGRYRVIVSYSPRFKRDTLEIIDVPGFSGIRIHSGNSALDTEGCPLPGENKVPGKVINSRHWTQVLFDKASEAINRKEEVWITVE
jgi:hypothetical protein